MPRSPSPPPRLPTLLPAHNINFIDEDTGVAFGRHHLHRVLPVPSADVAAAAREALPANSGRAMVMQATVGSLNRMFGEAWRDRRCQYLREFLVARRALPSAITNFVRHFMSALYAEEQESWPHMKKWVENYHIDSDTVIVTKKGRSNREWNDVYVPALSFPAAQARNGGPHSYSFERGQASTMVAGPTPLQILQGTQARATGGLQAYEHGEWHEQREKEKIDSVVQPNWALLPSDALKATWQFESLTRAVPATDPDTHLTLSTWKLDIDYGGGSSLRLKIHFDARLTQIQQNYELEYHLHENREEDGQSHGYTVCARQPEERPRRPVLHPPA